MNRASWLDEDEAHRYFFPFGFRNIVPHALPRLGICGGVTTMRCEVTYLGRVLEKSRGGLSYYVCSWRFLASYDMTYYCLA